MKHWSFSLQSRKVRGIGVEASVGVFMDVSGVGKGASVGEGDSVGVELFSVSGVICLKYLVYAKYPPTDRRIKIKKSINNEGALLFFGVIVLEVSKGGSERLSVTGKLCGLGS